MRKVALFLLVTLTITLTVSLAGADTSWYLPEGSTQGFDLWILVNNPGSTDATVVFTFYWSNNSGSGTLTYPETGTQTISAGARYTLSVNTLAEETAFTDLASSAISTKVTCTNNVNIYAERSMYWPSGDSSADWTGGHSARAVSGLESAITGINQPSSFPIAISASGSYKLTGNITCSSTTASAITITASNVTLDLNGFTITGPGKDGGAAGYGISIVSAQNIRIRNGTIYNFGSDGIRTSGSARLYISDMFITSNGGHGMFLGSSQGGIIEDCIIDGSGVDASASDGINFSSTGYFVVRNNLITSSAQNGITVGLGSQYNRVEGNTLGDNGAGFSIEILDADNMTVNNAFENAQSNVFGTRATVTTQLNTLL